MKKPCRMQGWEKVFTVNRDPVSFWMSVVALVLSISAILLRVFAR